MLIIQRYGKKLREVKKNVHFLSETLSDLPGRGVLNRRGQETARSGTEALVYRLKHIVSVEFC